MTQQKGVKMAQQNGVKINIGGLISSNLHDLLLSVI
mgnify:FL=1